MIFTIIHALGLFVFTVSRGGNSDIPSVHQSKITPVTSMSAASHWLSVDPSAMTEKRAYFSQFWRTASPTWRCWGLLCRDGPFSASCWQILLTPSHRKNKVALGELIVLGHELYLRVLLPVVYLCKARPFNICHRFQHVNFERHKYSLPHHRTSVFLSLEELLFKLLACTGHLPKSTTSNTLRGVSLQFTVITLFW